MFRMNRRMIVALLSVVSLVALIAPSALAQERTVLNVNWGTEPPTLDSSRASDTTSLTIIEALNVNLGRTNEITGLTEPGMATWTIEETDTSLIFTFDIMEGVPWVRYNAETGAVEQVLDENGEPRMVKAQDFAYAMLRTLDPATASDYAYVLMEAIKGGVEYNTSKATGEELQALRDAVGITVVDDYTLQIETPEKVPFYLDIVAGMWFGIAQPSWVIEEYGDFWTEPENIQTYGPYALEYWYHDDSLGLIANPFWPGTETVPQPAIPQIMGVMLTDASAAFANYEAGTLDVVGAPLSEMDRIKADPVLSEELHIGPSFCTYYYGFNVTKPPVDNVHLRRALSAAVDRQALIDNVTKGEQEPARWFSRPGLVAAPTMETHPNIGIGYDPAMAKEELAQALADLGVADANELPPITLMYNESTGHARIAEAIQQMWLNELGVNVQLATQEWGVFLETLDTDPPQIWRLGWCNDYFDADNFARGVFRSDAGNNNTRWGNPEFDRLVDEARRLSDVTERTELYAQAENILVYEDAAIIPLYWYTSVEMTKPYVNRTYALTGHQRYEKWSFAE